MKALAAVELQLRGGPLFLLLHGQMNGVQNQIHSLFCSGFAGHNATVIEARIMDRYSTPCLVWI